jgi:hypothetical protein
MLPFPHGMKKFTTLGGTLFLIWLLFSPVIAFYLFANYYDSLAARGINLLSLLVLFYLFFSLVGTLLMRALHQKFLVSVTGFVIYPALFLIGSALFAWVWERSVRSTVESAILSVGLFAVTIALDYFHIPLTWVMLCLAVIKELFPARPPILTTTAGAPNIASQN